MRRLPWLLCLFSMAVAMLVTQPAAAQERVFCEDGAGNVDCVDESFAVVFPILGAENPSIFEYAEFVPNGRIDATVVLDAVTGENGSGTIQGWSYGVRHDETRLRLLPDSVTVDGTDAAAHMNNGFTATTAVDGGWISAVILSLQEEAFLPLGRQIVAKASYELLEDVGAEGTTIRLVSREIGPEGSPATDINVTMDGRAFLPRNLTDGLIRRAVVPSEICDNGEDDDGDGLVDLDDPDCHNCPCPGGPGTCLEYAIYFGDRDSRADVDARGASSFAISGRNAKGLLGLQFGVAIRPEGDGFVYTFSDGLGTDNSRLVEVLMTDVDGMSIDPDEPNRLIADVASVINISRGAALAGFAGEDFLEFDLDPGVGGPGFFVGYVSNLDGSANVIPATGPDQGNGCPLNELFVVEIGAAECPGYAFYFGNQARVGEVDARGSSTFVLSSRNASALLGFQIGIRTTETNEGVVYQIVDDLGIDEDRLVEPLMTDLMGASITPATPNTLLASSATVLSVARGAALVPFEDGDFFSADFEPGVGGPGFFVGYVSDLDGAANVIPATTGEGCDLNELLVVTIDGGAGPCPEYAFAFDDVTRPEVTLEGGQFSIGGRNAEPLLGFQLGVSIEQDGDVFRYSFSGDLGTDDQRLIELLMTTNLGDSITPSAANTLIAPTGTVVAIERGAAVEAFAGSDFFEYDLAPGVGGPGFFVGYVSDLDDDTQVIPASSGEGCPTNELLVVHVGDEVFICPDNGFAFGVGGMFEEIAVVDIGDETSFSIGGRSVAPLLGFQGGFSIRPEGDAFRYRFAGDLGTDGDRPVELLMTDIDGRSLEAIGANTLRANVGQVTAISRGAGLEGFAGDFLAYDLEPGLNGPGVFFGYVSDLDDNEQVIPVPQGPGCPFIPLLEVTLVGGGDQPFMRGDANGNGRYDISDAVIIIQTILLNFPERFQCDDLLDVNDDESLDVVDAIPLLVYLFQAGEPFPAPFFECAQDPTPGALDCLESNCVDGP